MTLKGFSVPLTPQGNSALAKQPPWHYFSDCLAIEYWTDPKAIRVGSGYRLGMAYTVTDLQILKNYTEV